MSPFSKSIVLDNNCISNFYLAESLKQVLRFWPGVFKIPKRVLEEASRWPVHGSQVCQTVEELVADGIVETISIDEESEVEINAYIQLRLHAIVLGEGESESIAIASNRDYIIATDDRVATERCHELFPAIQVITTADIFKMAKSDGLLSQSEIVELWNLIKKKRSNPSSK
jgi:predicted nucleic acid-binding protein